MKKSEFIEIARKLMHIADSGKKRKGYPSVEPHYFDIKERKLLKQLIRKCNEVKIYDDENDDKTTREPRGQETNSTNLFSFQRDK